MDDKQYAYSAIEIKAVEDGTGRRMFKGIATTPTVDRVDDIVEPRGAAFKLPLPLCWMHDTRDPVGWVRSAKVTDQGIEIDGEIANLSEPASLKDRLDTAWAMLSSGLVRGLSIGFIPRETARIEGSYGYRFLKWEWTELSPVTVPANGDCSITSIKSADRAVRHAASGIKGGLPVVRLDRPVKADPGVSGKQPRRKGVVYLD